MSKKYLKPENNEHQNEENQYNIRHKINPMAQTQRLKSPRLMNDCIEFHISRYAFPPHRLFDDKVKFYKTSYECEGFQLTPEMMNRLTKLNRIDNFIKLKQIMKNVTKPNRLMLPQFARVNTSAYSLCYEVIQHSILSDYSINLFRNEKKGALQFAELLEYLTQFLIKSKIYYLLEIQNIGLNDKGKIKVYVPANFIIQNVKFDVQKQAKMRNTSRIIGEWFKNIDHYYGSLDVDDVKHQIQKQLQKLEIRTMNIESQIFTFNESPDSNYQKQLQNIHLRVQELDKTVKIRKASQKIEVNPSATIQKEEMFLNLKGNKKAPKCVTTRDQVKHYQDFQIKQEQHSMDEQIVPSLNRMKQNQFLNQKMKEYEDKLNSINSAVKQIKQLLTTKKQQKDHHHNSKTSYQLKFNEIHHSVEQFQMEQIQEDQNDQQNLQKSFIAEKLQRSRIYIKRLLNKENQLSQSFHLQEENTAKIKNTYEYEVQEYKERQNQQGIIPQKNQKKSNRSKSKTNKQNNDQKIDKNSSKLLSSNKLEAKNKEEINQFQYQSSKGKYSPPGGNPFRQYRPIRFQYVFNQNQVPQPNINQNIGFINIFPQPFVHPYQNSPTNQPQMIQNVYQVSQNQNQIPSHEHFFYRAVNPRDPYRLSCFAVRKNQKDEFQYIQIPYHHPFQNSQNGSRDTFQMELGKDGQYKMPVIVKKDAFRHTLKPQIQIKNRFFKCKSNSKAGSPKHANTKSNQGKDSLKGSAQLKNATRQQKNKRFYESAGSNQFLKAVRQAIAKQNNLSEKQYSLGKNSNRRQNKITINIKHPVINQSIQHSYITAENSHIFQQEPLPQKQQLSEKSRTRSNHNPNKQLPFHRQISRQKSHGPGKAPSVSHRPQRNILTPKQKFEQKILLQKQTLKVYQQKVKQLLNKSKKAIEQFKKGNMKNNNFR